MSAFNGAEDRWYDPDAYADDRALPVERDFEEHGTSQASLPQVFRINNRLQMPHWLALDYIERAK